ncbi:MAG: lipoate--protein ligase family protein, partial [Nesterenkonia sp.]
MSTAEELLVYRQRESLGAAEDLDLAITLLNGTRRYAQDPADAQATSPMIRIYRPQPTVAFGQRDQRMEGFDDAQQACWDLGFTPVVRRAGGRAAAYHHGSLVIDHIEPDPDPIRDSQTRFWGFGNLFAEALTAAGLCAQLGPIPGEYCYGEHSVHGRHPEQADVRIKLIGTAQRQIATGWLFSTSIIIEDGAPIRRVLMGAYEAMGLEWDPLTAGAAEDLSPGVTVEAVEQAILDTYAMYWDLRSTIIGPLP